MAATSRGSNIARDKGGWGIIHWIVAGCLFAVGMLAAFFAFIFFRHRRRNPKQPAGGQPQAPASEAAPSSQNDRSFNPSAPDLSEY